MDHPPKYLLDKIVGYKTNGLESLGYLNAKHIDDLSKVMQEFAEETAIEVIQRLNKGETITIRDNVYSLKRNKKK